MHSISLIKWNDFVFRYVVYIVARTFFLITYVEYYERKIIK